MTRSIFRFTRFSRAGIVLRVASTSFPGDPIPNTGRRLFPRVAFAVVACLYALVAGFHVAFGNLSADEGFYAAAARAVYEGELPYRDFGYTQTPLLPYINGAAMTLTGFGLFEQRAVNGLWGAIALAIGGWLLFRRGWGARAVFFGAVFILTPAWLYYVHLGKTYGWVSLLVMAATAVFLEGRVTVTRAVMLTILGVVATGSRLPAAPFFAMLCVASWWGEGRLNLRGMLASVLTALSGGMVLVWIFFLPALEAAWFWSVDFFRISVPQRLWHVAWQDIAGLCPAVWILVVVAVGYRLRRGTNWPARETVVLLAALLALGMNLLMQGAYDEYGVPFLPALAVSVLLLMPKSAATSSWFSSRWVATGLLAMSFALLPALYWSRRPEAWRLTVSTWLPLNAAPYNFQLPQNLERASAAVRRALPPGENFHGSAIILALEADRPIPPRLRMGAFAMSADYPADKAERLQLMTFEELARIYAGGGARVIGAHAEQVFDHLWSVPSFRYQRPDIREQWFASFRGRYEVSESNRDFVVLVPKSTER